MTQDKRAADAYARSGVDIASGLAFIEAIRPLAAKTARPGSNAALGGFGGLFDLKAAGFEDPLLVASTDGVGTKLLLAEAADRLEGLGQDLVAMCVNDLVVQGAEPLFFLDYLATGRLDVKHGRRIVAGIADACRESGCALLGGETAEMPGVYAPGTFDLAGFALGAVERGSVLPNPCEPGDVLLGLAASGPHSNGFSLIRKILAEHNLSPHDPAPFDPLQSLADALLAPTRLYVRPCLAAIRTGGVRALAHVTGGGLIENPPRALEPGLCARIDLDAWDLPPVFAWLARAGDLGRHDLARTFNCGLGMILVVAQGAVQAVAAALDAADEPARRIGVIEAAPPGTKPSVRFEGGRAWPEPA